MRIRNAMTAQRQRKMALPNEYLTSLVEKPEFRMGPKVLQKFLNTVRTFWDGRNPHLSYRNI